MDDDSLQKIPLMNIKAAILSVLALLCSLCATAQYQIHPVDWKELKTLVKEEPERVRELVRRISTPQRDTTLTYPDQIIAYFGQSLLTNDSEESLVHAMDQAYSEENYAEALAQAEKVLAVNPVNIKALIRVAYAIANMREAGDESHAHEEGQGYYSRAIRLLDTIAATGYGSEEHPFHVTKIADEYLFMGHYLELDAFGSQSLIDCCNVFELGKGNRLYPDSVIYFDATRVLELEAAMFGGGK